MRLLRNASSTTGLPGIQPDPDCVHGEHEAYRGENRHDQRGEVVPRDPVLLGSYEAKHAAGGNYQEQTNAGEPLGPRCSASHELSRAVPSMDLTSAPFDQVLRRRVRRLRG